MVVFITGGTGLLGNNIVKDLLVRGFHVKALVRRPDAGEILGPGVELIQGNVREVENFEKHLAKAEVLIHAAACYGEFYRTGAKADLIETNVGGTTALLAAAARQGVGNVVFISSSAVLETRNDQVTDENSPYPENTNDPYFSSKIEAEKAVFRFLDKNPDIRIVPILPAVMLGPGDRGPTPTGNFILKLMHGEVKFVLPGWHRIVDARDVAGAAVEAITKGRSGERYLIGGRRYSLAEIFQAVSEITGHPGPKKAISPGRLLLASYLMGLAGRITRRPPFIKPAIVRRLQENFTYGSAKAERELGVRFRPFSETIADTINWFQTNKFNWRGQ